MGILEFSQVTFGYGAAPFIRDLSLAMEGSRFTGLIGANGSGKSTVLKLSAGILKPVAGQVMLWGKPLHCYRGEDRAKLISYLPQMLDLQVPFRVRELVEMGLYPYRVLPELSVEEAVSMVGLEQKMDTYVTELSGGERRRAFLAMTLVQGAGIVLLDEPLANLDIKYQIELIRLLQKLRDSKGISIMMALHDINLAFQFDDLYVIRRGGMMAHGEPDRVITDELLEAAFDVGVRTYRQENGTISVGYV